MLFDRLQVFDETEPHDAALNMAIDEALLEQTVLPALRFYRWSRPAISFGYFGRYAEVAGEAERRDLVRRWTGGGIVPHDEDLTYSIIIPATDASFASSSADIYRGVHSAIQDALEACGTPSTLATGPSARTSEHCFANPVRADVMSNGHKVAGAAHRRTRHGLLHQGSIQLGNLLPKFRSDLSRFLSEKPEPAAMSSTLLSRAGAISESKYGTAEWLRRR